MTKHRNPLPTVDVIIEMVSSEKPSQGLTGGGIVLVERKNQPRGWALPGGFVDYGEPLAAAARREAREETGLEIELIEQFHAYSDPTRDPRQHTISTVYLARASGTPVGADDALRARVFTRATLPGNLVFDHQQILADYFEYREHGKRPPASR
ncbi:MAG: NUDIX hydrolase [Proteobacteria bacterium]|nr:NUDIX hydrolase [Pseudomonadota bacterium]